MAWSWARYADKMGKSASEHPGKFVYPSLLFAFLAGFTLGNFPSLERIHALSGWEYASVLALLIAALLHGHFLVKGIGQWRRQ